MNKFQVKSSFLDWFADAYGGVMDVGPGQKFDPTNQSKWVFAVVRDVTIDPHRKDGETEGTIEIELTVYVRSPTHAFEADEEAGTISDLLKHAEIPVKDNLLTGKPQIGHIRLHEPKVTDASDNEGDIEIQCQILTISGTIQTI